MSHAFSPPARLASRIPPSFAAWIVSSACLIATACAWHDVSRSRQLDARAQFERRTAHAVKRIKQALSSCEQALRSAAVLIDSQAPTGARWRDYTAALSSAPPVPGIQEFGFVPSADPEFVHGAPGPETGSVQQVLKLARIATLHPGATVAGAPHELAPDRLSTAAPRRSLPPPAANVQPVGAADMPPVTALMYLPARSHDALHESGSQSGRLLGYAYARVGIADLIENALQETEPRFRIRVFEGRRADPEFLLYDSSRNAVTAQADAADAMLSKSADIDLNGNRWTIRFDASQESLLSSSNGRAGTYLLAAGLILALSLFGTTRAVVRARKDVPTRQEHSHQELKNLVDALETLRDQEQKRLAQEMHDDLGQLLAAMKMDLAGLARHVPQTDSTAKQRLDSINELVSTMMTSVRRIISDLPPKALEDLGLFDALQLMATNFERRHHVRCHIGLPQCEPRIPQKAASAIYRMVQESLTNVTKHACATDVEISMEILDNRILLSIADNGKGFSAKVLQKAGSFGLIGMRERAASLNGGMKVESAIGSGTTIYITLPLDDKRHGGTESAMPAVVGEGT